VHGRGDGAVRPVRDFANVDRLVIGATDGLARTRVHEGLHCTMMSWGLIHLSFNIYFK
jgi:hypothetical protein